MRRLFKNPKDRELSTDEIRKFLYSSGFRRISKESASIAYRSDEIWTHHIGNNWLNVVVGTVESPYEDTVVSTDGCRTHGELANRIFNLV
jgi:hypothetical protein